MLVWFLVYLCCSTAVLVLVLSTTTQVQILGGLGLVFISGKSVFHHFFFFVLVLQTKIFIHSFSSPSISIWPQDISHTFWRFCCFSNSVSLNWCSLVAFNIFSLSALTWSWAPHDLSWSSLGLNISGLGVVLVLVNVVLTVSVGGGC